jgi:hypothetical protein
VWACAAGVEVDRAVGKYDKIAKILFSVTQCAHRMSLAVYRECLLLVTSGFLCGSLFGGTDLD